jgi:hypothetical protein
MTLLISILLALFFLALAVACCISTYDFFFNERNDFMAMLVMITGLVFLIGSFDVLYRGLVDFFNKENETKEIKLDVEKVQSFKRTAFSGKHVTVRTERIWQANDLGTGPCS